MTQPRLAARKCHYTFPKRIPFFLPRYVVAVTWLWPWVISGLGSMTRLPMRRANVLVQILFRRKNYVTTGLCQFVNCYPGIRLHVNSVILTKINHLYASLTYSCVARVWRTVPTPGAQITKGRQIVRKLHFYLTIKSKFFHFTFWNTYMLSICTHYVWI
jgi:hypothetical protein